jgi:hypothetical protein
LPTSALTCPQVSPWAPQSNSEIAWPLHQTTLSPWHTPAKVMLPQLCPEPGAAMQL